MKNRNALRPKWIAVYSFSRRAPAREFLVFVAFCLLTAVMTWPWVLHLRDAVADRGDPYMIAWTLWSDYHQTFHSPTHIFDANIFYPYKYTLAFSENDYGIGLLFFPLFAIGLKPLTVHSIATFLGFAFSGYGAFRLTRTLTGRNGPSWIAGIVFAFIPFRFHVLSHLHYLFAGWIPLMLESLVLFARRASWQRATIRSSTGAAKNANEDLPGKMCPPERYSVESAQPKFGRFVAPSHVTLAHRSG